jgi:tetratricopeptide (TPR) repeat protein
MATVTAKAFDVVALDDIEPGPEHDGRVPRNIRRHFDIQGFGVRANQAVGDGHVIGEHDEISLGATGQEELYFVLSGAATFNLDGQPVYAPAGTFVFVRDPAVKRSAIAKQDGTTVLAVGATPGEPYRLSVGEVMHDMWDPYRAGDYEGALEALQPALAERPEALVLFNVACMEAQLGRADDAIAHLEQAIEDDHRIKDNIRTDTDLDSIREDPRFQALTA